MKPRESRFESLLLDESQPNRPFDQGDCVFFSDCTMERLSGGSRYGYCNPIALSWALSKLTHCWSIAAVWPLALLAVTVILPLDEAVIVP